MSGHIVPLKTYVAVFLALAGLTVVTTAAAFVDLERMNTVVALVIAVTKMLLVILFFMHVKYSPGLTKIVVLAGFFWLAIMVSLSLADELTRGWTPSPAPWSVFLPVLHIFR
jgi:cytochrome c oxidase subunit IV